MYFFSAPPPKKREETPTAAPQEMKMIPYFCGGSQDDPEIFKGPSINLVPIQSCWRFTPPGVLYRLSNQLLSDLMDKNLGFCGFDEHHTFGGIKWMLKQDVSLILT